MLYVQLMLFSYELGNPGLCIEPDVELKSVTPQSKDKKNILACKLNMKPLHMKMTLFRSSNSLYLLIFRISLSTRAEKCLSSKRFG